MDGYCDNCGEEISICDCEKCSSCNSLDDIEDNGICADCNEEQKDYEETVRTRN